MKRKVVIDENDSLNDALTTLSLKNVDLPALLDEITKQTLTIWTIKEGDIYILPQEDREEKLKENEPSEAEKPNFFNSN